MLCLLLAILQAFSQGATVYAGPDFPHGQLQSHARVHFQGKTNLTTTDIENTLAQVPEGHSRLRRICQALSGLTRPAEGEVEAEKPQKELHVFSNPLFGSC